MRLELDTSGQSGHTVVTVRGEVDLLTASRLRDCLAELADGDESRLVVDLDQVDFIDSSGIGVLVGAAKRARRRGGELTLVCNRDRILKVLHITGLDQVFAIHQSVES